MENYELHKKLLKQTTRAGFPHSVQLLEALNKRWGQMVGDGWPPRHGVSIAKSGEGVIQDWREGGIVVYYFDMMMSNAWELRSVEIPAAMKPIAAQWYCDRWFEDRPDYEKRRRNYGETLEQMRRAVFLREFEQPHKHEAELITYWSDDAEVFIDRRKRRRDAIDEANKQIPERKFLEAYTARKDQKNATINK